MGSLLYIYGGFSSSDMKVFDELWTLNTSTVNWNSKTLELPGAIYEKVTVNGDIAPGPLRGHAAVNINDEGLLIFGGVRQDPIDFSNDFYFFEQLT